MGSDWSQAEANRTIDEVKRRALIDREFRVLALSNAARAVAKINPKALPAGLSIQFVEAGDAPVADPPGMLVIVLPEIIETEHLSQLSNAELDLAVGGIADIRFPTKWKTHEEE
jgi:hypothetical protein